MQICPKYFTVTAGALHRKLKLHLSNKCSLFYMSYYFTNDIIKYTLHLKITFVHPHESISVGVVCSNQQNFIFIHPKWHCGLNMIRFPIKLCHNRLTVKVTVSQQVISCWSSHLQCSHNIF